MEYTRFNPSTTIDISPPSLSSDGSKGAVSQFHLTTFGQDSPSLPSLSPAGASISWGAHQAEGLCTTLTFAFGGIFYKKNLLSKIQVLIWIRIFFGGFVTKSPARGGRRAPQTFEPQAISLPTNALLRPRIDLRLLGLLGFKLKKIELSRLNSISPPKKLVEISI